MDSAIELLEFQLNRIGYQFQNLDFLLEATTHSAPKFNFSFPGKNNWNYERLCCLGEPLLKFLASQYVLMVTKIGPENMTWLKSRLLETSNQNEIGKRLFCKNGAKRPILVQVDSGNWINPGFVFPYHKVVKALFGAIFIDSGGTSGFGLQKCHQVFLKLWRPYLKHKGEMKKIQYCFPSPKREVTQFWLKNGLNLKFIRKMEQRLGLSEFRKGDILCEAVIQKSFYDLIRNDPVVGKMHQPDYERLEFLGDSVLGVVIMEHIWNLEANMNATEMVAAHTKFITDDYQLKIFNRLGLGDFVKMKRGRIQGWDKRGDIVESVVAAVYVDGGIKKARDFVLRSWGLPLRPSLKSPDMMDLQRKLNYKFKNPKNLEYSLSTGESHQNPQILCEDIGRPLLSFFSVDYILRSIKVNGRTLEKETNFVSGKDVLKGIAIYLDISKLVDRRTTKDGKQPEEKLENFVVKILGAVWRDLNESKSQDMIKACQKVFYHLWNPYLKYVPRNSISEVNTENVTMTEDERASKMEECIQYDDAFSLMEGEWIFTLFGVDFE